jgi:pimeloyl-ACP methyl ester carboxylesterase
MMNRRTLIGAAAAVAAFPVLNRVASAQTSLKTKNVVFVHGLFADGSCWSKVIARLQQKDVNCTSVQNPLTSLHEASETARRAIAAQPGPTVLVGHSFSGMIVTEVGWTQRSQPSSTSPRGHPMPAKTIRRWRRTTRRPRPQPALSSTTTGAGCPRRHSCTTSRVLYAVQQPFKKSLTTEMTANAAWRAKPTFYAVSTQDRTINPDLERFMAKRMGAKTIEIEASHLALVSHPDAITNLVLEALAV